MINLSDILFTKRCPFCQKVIELSKNECNECAAKLPKSGIRTVGNIKCAYAFPYTGVYRRAVLEYKFNGHRYMAKALAWYLKLVVEQNFDLSEIDYITYVPIFMDKKFKFNHCKRLAKHLSKHINIPCESLLIKTIKTAKQHDLDYESRKKNIKNAFSSTTDLHGKGILIVDDIITTGSTLSECINILSSSGAKKIFAATVCCVTDKSPKI